MDLRRGPVRAVHAAVPDGIDDPADPSGGNSYDRRTAGSPPPRAGDVRVLVLPSRFEAYGKAVTEALGFGLPVIAASVGGVPEALGMTDHGPPGVLVPPDEP